MRKLVWTQYALLDRDAIFDYIVAESPTAAVRVDEQIGLAIRRLTEFPESGRLGRVLGTRELVISQTSYVAAYTFADDAIRILRILHGAQMWPDELNDGEA